MSNYINNDYEITARALLYLANFVETGNPYKSREEAIKERERIYELDEDEKALVRRTRFLANKELEKIKLN